MAGLLLFQYAPAAVKPDLAALNRDLVISRQAEGRFTLVLWLPPQYWRASLEASGALQPSKIDQMVKDLSPYAILAVADGRRSLATLTFSEPELVRRAVTIDSAAGERLSALADDQISDGVRTFLEMMLPALRNTLGSLGGHMAFVLFPAADKDGRPTVDPLKDGAFVVHVGDADVRYRLPLGSLLPPEVDTKTGESFPGNYHFNPFTGAKLSPAAAGD
ncbi:MAG: hypothetical protein JOZ67_10230 [Gammaproteobacteria bacterium]|nr:hypothetical protein [Gammaproteobacteria bacterium]